MHFITTSTLLMPLLAISALANPVAAPTYTERGNNFLAAEEIASLMAQKQRASAKPISHSTVAPLETQPGYVGVDSLKGGAMETFTAAPIVNDAHGEKKLFSGHGDGAF